VPVHAVVTASQPFVRFIGNDSQEENQRWFEPWIAKLAHWQTENTPYLFIHTPDIGFAPELARLLWPKLSAVLSDMPPCPHWPEQSTLF
ncbi:DUF72 domain-containing protein, partial [Lonsdalea populi]